MRNPRNDDLALADEREPHVPERTCVLTRRKGTQGRADPPGARPRRRASRPTSAPARQAAAPGSASPAPSSTRRTPRASSRERSSARSRPASVTVPADLGERTEAALRQTGARPARHGSARPAISSTAPTGSKPPPARARSHLLIHAADAGEDGRKKLDQAWRVGGGGPQGVIFPEPRTILSMALGRDNVVHVALTDPAAASRVQHALARWRAFTGPDRGLEGGEPALRTGSAEADLTKE